MIYDEKLSENVNLSDVLDCLINDNEKFSVIINFLDRYTSDEKDDIVVNSMSFHTILNCLYFADMKNEEVDWFFDNIIKSSKISKKYEHLLKLLSWQILTADFNDYIKTKFRNYIHTVKTYFDKHPYSGYDGKRIEEYEKLLFEDKNIDSAIYNINRMTDESFSLYIKHIKNSLYLSVLFSSNLFLNLDFKKQYVFITLMESSNHEKTYSLFVMLAKSLLCSSECDLGIKLALYNDKVLRYFNWSISSEAEDVYRESSSFAEMMMRLELMGKYNLIRDIIIKMVIEKDTELLIEMYEYDKKLIEDNFNIVDLVERLMENAK